MSSSSEVLSIGNLNIDLIGKLNRIPNPDEKVLMKSFSRRPGGGAANFATACSKLGLKPGFLGYVGNDSFGEEILEDLQRNGVDTSHIKKVEDYTGLALVLSAPGKDRFLIEHRGANSRLAPEDLKENIFEGINLVHASSVGPEMARAIGKKARGFGATSSLDLGAELTEVEGEELLEILGIFDICFMNEETFGHVFDEIASEEAVLRYFPQDLEVLVVTLGSKGALATDGEKVVAGPTYDVEVKDTTGAGDAFAAAFNKSRLDGEALDKTIKYATAEAAIKVQHLGAREGLPSERELKRFVQNRDSED